MNPREQSDAEFDRLADGELRRLERAFDAFDPDEVEPTMGGDVLTLTLGNGGKIIINRHRAARQIWMAAARQAWHFDHDPATGQWRAGPDELWATVQRTLSEALRRPVTLRR